MELYLHSPNMPSWCGAKLKHRDKFTITNARFLSVKTMECDLNEVHRAQHTLTLELLEDGGLVDRQRDY